jgi:hypothetical protein
MDKAHLPRGTHWGLHITGHPAEDAGAFAGGGHKLLWHTTEGTNIDTMVRVLEEKRAAPHIVVDFYHSRVVQMIPFNRAARALEHNGGPETNRANCVQVEICDYAKNSQDWTERQYGVLAALAVLIEHRVPIPRHANYRFRHPVRLGGQQFVDATGHLGHCHVPGNSHWDPGEFNVARLFRLMRTRERENQ